MFSIVLATALTAGTAVPDAGFGFSFGHGCHGCYGCYGGYPAFAPVKVYYGCGGCYGGCYGACYGGCYGACYGGCYGCWGGCYGCYGGCNGCWGGCCGGAWGPPVYSWAPPKMQPAGEGQGDDPQAEAATVVVHAPKDVELRFNGVKVKRSGAKESFKTPALPKGRDFHYIVTATVVLEGRRVSDERRVVVRAGKEAEVDFREKEMAE